LQLCFTSFPIRLLSSSNTIDEISERKKNIDQ